MSYDTDFLRFWEEPLQPPLLGAGSGPCPFARQFGEWTQELWQNVRLNATENSIELAMLDLTRRYFDWYRTVPPPHRAIADEGDHSCIFHVFRDAYERLWALHLTAAPRSFVLPTAPRPRPQPKFEFGFVIPAREED